MPRDEAGHHHEPTRTGDLRQPLVTLLLGAAIGFLPTAGLAVYQANQQQRQLLLDRKLTALQHFTAAVSGGGELLSALSELEAAIRGLEMSKRKPEDWSRVDAQYKAVVDARFKWAADVSAHAAVMHALFPPDPSAPPECENRGKPLSFSQLVPQGSFDWRNEEETIASMRKDAEGYRKAITAAIDNTLETIRCQAERISR